MKTNVYVAILNKGWNRVELTFGLIKMLLVNQNTNLKFTIEDPKITQGYPISSNRNMIKKRFMGTDCSFLMMFDCDNAPFGDPAELVLADKDIVGCPCRTRNGKGELVWTAYEKIGNGYVNIDLDKLENPPDFMPVDAVGAGFILIKRCVLASMKVPFVDSFDEHGEWKLGEDISFCEKAIEAGFKVYTTPKMKCEHFKCDGLYGLEKSILEKKDVKTETTIR